MTILIVTNEGIIADRYVDSENIRATGRFLRQKLFHSPELNVFVTIGVFKTAPDNIAIFAEFAFNKYREHIGLEVTKPVDQPDCESFEILIIPAPYSLKGNLLLTFDKNDDHGVELVDYNTDTCYTYGHESNIARLSYMATRNMFSAYKVAKQDYVTVSSDYNYVEFKKLSEGIKYVSN